MKKFALLISALTFSAPAFAYLDPGSGSAIISAIIGFFVAVGMAIKTYWYKLKSFFIKTDTTQDDAKQENTAEKSTSQETKPEN